MTLKEKFENNITGIVGKEQIAGEFAIGFAEWVLDVYIEHKQNYILEELLEIYKKEKGL
jgi:hypothetical protein